MLSNYPPGVRQGDEDDQPIEHRRIDCICTRCDTFTVAEAVFVKGTNDLIEINNACPRCSGDLATAI